MSVQSKQDRQGVRIAADLERKYKLGNLDVIQEEIIKLKKTIDVLSQEFEQYREDVNNKLTEIDENISKNT